MEGEKLQTTHRANSSKKMGVKRLSYNKLGDLNTRNLFLTLLESGQSKIKVLQVWWLERIFFLACSWLPSSCVLAW